MLESFKSEHSIHLVTTIRKDLLRDMKEQLGGMFGDTMLGLVSEATR